MAKASIKTPLTDEEKEFALEYAKTGDKKLSYHAAFGEDAEYDSQAAHYLLNRTAVKKFIEESKRPGSELAKNIYKKQMLTGTDKQQSDAAKLFTQLFGDQEQSGDVFTHWAKMMTAAGAQVVIPPHTNPVTITFESFLRGEAHIHLPLEAKLWLLKKAGAPWNDKDPEATVSPIQTDALSREDRELLILGGTGLGKSALGGMFAMIELLLPKKNVAIIAQFYKHVGDEFKYIVEGLKNLFPDGMWRTAFPVLKCTNQLKYQEYQVTSIWGSEAKGYSAGEQEGAMILGSGFDLVVCGEGDLIPYGVYTRKIRRSMDRRAMKTGPGYRTGRIVMFTTPAFGEGAASCIFNRVMDETNGKLELAAFPNVPWAESVWIRSGSFLDNPSNSVEVYEATKKMLLKDDPDAFYEQYEGQLRKRSGVVLKEFDRSTHVVEMPPVAVLRQMRFGVGIDPGSKFGAVLVGKTRDNKYYVLAEAYNEFTRVKENVDTLKDRCVDVLAPLIGFKPGADSDADWKKIEHLIEGVFVDRASEQKLEIEDEIGTNTEFVALDVQGTISSLRQMMVENRFLVVDECVQWIKDAGRYTFKTQKGMDTFVKTGEIRKSHDHLVDATRYIIFGCMELLDPTEDRPVALSFEEAHQAHIRKQMEDDAWARPNQQPIAYDDY